MNAYEVKRGQKGKTGASSKRGRVPAPCSKVTDASNNGVLRDPMHRGSASSMGFDRSPDSTWKHAIAPPTSAKL